MSNLSFALSIVQGICFLLYPLAGILADMYLTRLKAMFYGTYIQLIGTVLVFVITVIFIRGDHSDGRPNHRDNYFLIHSNNHYQQMILL